MAVDVAEGQGLLTSRDPDAVTARPYDLVVVGGGIYGALVALEAVLRGLQPLLCERDDFGGATTNNSLRVLHGGFRYLQTLDLPRFLESVRERRWYSRAFPELVRPLPCLLPLYGRGLQRRTVLGPALLANDLLSWRRNAGVAVAQRLPSGRLVSRRRVQEIFPAVGHAGLQGGAVWHDAFVPSTERLVIEVLRQACSLGATVLNYAEVGDVVQSRGAVARVIVHDHVTGGAMEVTTERLINAAGPWSGSFAETCGCPEPGLFEPSLAWNVVFDRPALSSHAVALPPRGSGGGLLFAVPWRGVILAGTGHAPWPHDDQEARVPDRTLDSFISDLNHAVPGLDLQRSDVARVFAGLLPVTRAGSVSLTRRPVVIDHGERGGPRGLFSISGIKLTTARRVAEAVIRRAFPESRKALPPAPAAPRRTLLRDLPFAWLPDELDGETGRELRRIADEEAVHHLDDLLFRRTGLGDNPERAIRLAPAVCRLLGWDAERTGAELDRLDLEASPGRLPGPRPTPVTTRAE